MRVSVGVSSDVGRVREGNEDSYLIDDPLYVVADGMGGHLAGDVASRIAVETISEGSGGARSLGPDELAALVRKANENIWTRSQNDPSLRGMGTTCTLVMFDDGEAHLAHVGDSRAYLLRSQELSMLTEDHTLVGRMVREGRLKPEDAERHPQRSIITRALGVDSEIDVDTMTLKLQEGDRILICSDGLTSMLREPALREVLSAESDPQRAADRLVELANEAGGEDNITVIVLRVGDEGARADAPQAESEGATPEPMRYDTPAAGAPPAVTTGALRPAPAPPPEPRSRWPRALAWTLGLAILLGGGAYLATRWVLANSYFVGGDDEGNVVIYRGRPEEIAGMSLREEEEQTGLTIEELPEFLRDGVEEGIAAESLEDAQEKVADLEDRAQDAEFGQQQKRSGSN